MRVLDWKSGLPLAFVAIAAIVALLSYYVITGRRGELLNDGPRS